jgi:uncharacterized protein
MPRCLAAASLSALMMVAAVPQSGAASFDCSRAATAVESAVCEDRTVSALDEQMTRSYRALLNRTSGATEAQIRAEQKDWLRRRNACGGDTGCLANEYRARIRSIAEWSGAPAAAAAGIRKEQPRTVAGGVLDRGTRSPTPAPTQAETTAEKPGLLERMMSTVTPGLRQKDDEPARAEPARTQSQQPPPLQEPLRIVGQRPDPARTTARIAEPERTAEEPARPKTAARRVQQPKVAAPAPAQQDVALRQEPQPQPAAQQPARQRFVLYPVPQQQTPDPVPQQQTPAPQTAPATVRQDSAAPRKWQDLSIGTGVAAPEARLRGAKTEPAREADRVRTMKEPVAESPAPEPPALTYAPEDAPLTPPIFRQEPRIQVIRPLIVRDRAPASEPGATGANGDTAAVPSEAAATTAAAPEAAPPAPGDIPELAALPEATPTHSPAASPVQEALKSRFDTAYGSPDRIDLLAPLRQTRRGFDPGRFDIFEDPPGG